MKKENNQSNNNFALVEKMTLKVLQQNRIHFFVNTQFKKRLNSENKQKKRFKEKILPSVYDYVLCYD